jgi:poly(hydroxyalkanoate) granule-associated protein
MTEQTDNFVANGQENGANVFTRIGDMAVKTLMVGLGTVGFAQDELRKIWEGSSSLVGKLEERGESMSETGRERLNRQRETLTNQVESRQEKVKDLSAKANESFEKASGAVLTLANVPTAEDIQNLSKQIGSLNRKVDKLRKEQQELAAAEGTVQE